MSSYDSLWLVSNGAVTQRIMAENPQQAFERATTVAKNKGAKAVKIVYDQGEECMEDLAYAWREGGAIPLLSPSSAWSDPHWTDKEPETKPYDAPIVSGKSVLLVGYGLSRAMTGHYLRRFPNAVRWGLNRDRCPGVKRHFQIHDPKVCTNMPKAEFEYDDLVARGVEIITLDNFPFDKMRRQFWTSTADYMLALADYEGYEHICLPGLDYGGLRRMQELIGSAYWIGVLEGKGAKVYRSPMSMLFRHIHYGKFTEKEHDEYERCPEPR